MEQNQLEIKLKKSETFKQIYSTGAIGGHTSKDFRIAFYNECQNFENMKTIDRIIENEIILTPSSALELSLWLNSHIEIYEKQFGKISKNKNQNIQEPKSKIIEGYM